MIDEGPAIILAEPQLGENIGMVARAMANFGLGELRLVAPRDGWPNERAMVAASGADYIIAICAPVLCTDAPSMSVESKVFAYCFREDSMMRPTSVHAWPWMRKGTGSAALAAPAPKAPKAAATVTASSA
jgi:tRNA/rRNA methyltransferase